MVTCHSTNYRSSYPIKYRIVEVLGCKTLKMHRLLYITRCNQSVRAGFWICRHRRARPLFAIWSIVTHVFSGRRKTPARSMTCSARNLEREKRPLIAFLLLLVAEKTTLRSSTWMGQFQCLASGCHREILLLSALSPRSFPSTLSLFSLFFSLWVTPFISPSRFLHISSNQQMLSSCCF